MVTFLYSATASADGYIAGPEGDMSWLLPFLDEEPDPVIAGAMKRVTAILMGRRTFEGSDPHAGDPEKEGAFEGQWEGPQVVLTHRALPDLPPGFSVEHSFDGALASARVAAGTDGVVNILGADLARQCLDAGVIDEVIIGVAPVLLGSGTPLPSGAAGPIRLELLHETPADHSSGGIHVRHHRVLR